MLTHYVKVIINRKAIYLERSKYKTIGGKVFLTGYQVNKQCEPVSKKGDTIHIIEVGSSSGGSLPLFTPSSAIKIFACEVNKTYCEIEAKRRIQ